MYTHTLNRHTHTRVVPAVAPTLAELHHAGGGAHGVGGGTLVLPELELRDVPDLQDSSRSHWGKDKDELRG